MSEKKIDALQALWRSRTVLIGASLMKWTQQETGLKQAQNVEFLFRWKIFKLIPLYVFFAISTFIFVEYYLRFFQQINSNWTQKMYYISVYQNFLEKKSSRLIWESWLRSLLSITWNISIFRRCNSFLEKLIFSLNVLVYVGTWIISNFHSLPKKNLRATIRETFVFAKSFSLSNKL